MNIYVGNLARSVNENELRTIFEEFGQVASVRIPMDRITGQARGFAFVEMSSAEEAQRAIDELNGRDVAGRTITVNEARPREPRTGGAGRGDYGGGGGRSFDRGSGSGSGSGSRPPRRNGNGGGNGDGWRRGSW